MNKSIIPKNNSLKENPFKDYFHTPENDNVYQNPSLM